MALKIIQVLIRTLGINTSIFYYFELNFTRRDNKLAKPLFWSMAALNFIWGFWIGYTDITDSFFALFSVTPILVALALCYKESFFYKLIIFIVASVIGAVGCEFLVQVIIQLIYDGKPLDLTEVSFKTTLGLCIMTVLVFVMYHLVTNIAKSLRLGRFHADKSLIFFVLVILSQFFLTLNLNNQYTNYREIFDKYCFFPFYFIGVILSVVSDILLFKVLMDNCTARYNKLKLAELEYERKLSLNYYENISKNAEMIMKYKHDFNNILGTAYCLIQTDDRDSKQQGMKMLDELFEKNKAASIPYYCKNPLINAIIYDKSNSAKELGIDFSAHIDIPEEIKMELTDLCSIFTNLIDNAFKSAKESKCKKVELSVRYDMEMLFVISKNYPDSTPSFEKHQRKLGKERLSAHGYGLDILNDIAQKYQGSVKIKTEAESVEVLVAVKG